MATLINLEQTPHSYFKDLAMFSFNERHVPFATQYEVVNPKTGNSMLFELSHSTGPEFDPKTCWIYFNVDKTLSLKIANDKVLTQLQAQRYLNAKTKRLN